MNLKKLLPALLLLGALPGAALAGPQNYNFPSLNTSYATINLPDPTAYTLQYGDFLSYSLSLLSKEGMFDLNSFAASGQLKGLPVIATGDNATAPLPAGMDESYSTSSSTQHQSAPFSTSFNGSSLNTYTLGNKTYSKGVNSSQTTTWDINTSLLQTFLGGNQLVILFDNNQSQNATTGLTAFGQIELWNSTNANAPKLYFDFVSTVTDNGVNTGIFFNKNVYNYTDTQSRFISDITQVNFTADSGQTGKYVNIPTQITDPSNGVTAPANVGGSAPDFALISPEINALLSDKDLWKTYDTMSFFVDLGNRDGGSEEIYLARGATAATPEPGTMLLMGAGALGAAWMRRRKMKNSN